jgi:cytochrome c peroxidase
MNVLKRYGFLLFVFGCASFGWLRNNDFKKPKHFPKPVYDFDKNPIKSNKVELGRLLFFDPILSLDNTISCASCHSPYNAFAHTDHKLSHGIGDSIGSRNAPALFNLAWQKSFMWDGAINHLDVQALAPLTDNKEMGEDLKNVIRKLSNKEMYVKAFKRAFGSDEITGEKLLLALSQFQLTLVSADSKYDRVKLGEEEFTRQEEKGYKIFQNNCASCHAEPLFSNYELAKNSLPIDELLLDKGRRRVSGQKEDSMLFKVPSLRNLSFSYPYMHDGRFDKLSQVVKHYVDIGELDIELDQRVQNIKKLSSNEQVDLISFLLCLNDKAFVFNPKHQFPKEILNQAKE